MLYDYIFRRKEYRFIGGFVDRLLDITFRASLRAQLDARSRGCQQTPGLILKHVPAGAVSGLAGITDGQVSFKKAYSGFFFGLFDYEGIACSQNQDTNIHLRAGIPRRFAAGFC